LQPFLEQESQNPEIPNFTKFPKKPQILEMFELPDKKGFKPMETRKKIFLQPGQPPFIN